MPLDEPVINAVSLFIIFPCFGPNTLVLPGQSDFSQQRPPGRNSLVNLEPCDDGCPNQISSQRDRARVRVGRVLKAGSDRPGVLKGQCSNHFTNSRSSAWFRSDTAQNFIPLFVQARMLYPRRFITVGEVFRLAAAGVINRLIGCLFR